MKRILKLLAFAVIAAVTCSCGKDNGYVDDGEYDPFGDKDKPTGNIDPNDDTEYYPKAEGSLRIMAYNVGAFSKFMQNSTSMVADMILEIKADVVGLNELDSINTRHKVNQVAALAQELGGWKWYFGRAMDYKGGAYGNGVVVPKDVNIIDKYFVTLPQPVSGGEQRSIAVVETDKYVIGACHMGGSALNQVAVVNSWVEKKYKNYNKPVFFVGDMNAVVGSEHIETLKQKFNIISNAQNSVPVDAPTRCIDYVFHYKKSTPVEVTGTATLTRFRKGDPTKASDHLPVYADVKF